MTYSHLNQIKLFYVIIFPMIHLTPEARLNIILPNTNKALADAIKNATPEQLETLKEGKDIKSLLTSVFQDKTTASKSDQTLLDLLKNSSAFKNMGSFTDTFQSLLKEMKTSPDMAQNRTVLEKFLKNVTALDPQNLKTQIASSGVLMESKIAAALNKVPDLIHNLETLKSLLTKIPTNEAKALHTNVAALLSNPTLPTASTNPQSALQLTNGIKKITETIQSLIAKTDPLYSKEVAVLAAKLDQLSTLPEIKTILPEIKTTLSELYGTLLSSKAPKTNALLDSIEKLLKNLNTSPLKEVKTLTTQLNTAIDQNDVSKELTAIKAKLGEFTHPKELLTETFLKESMAEDLKSNLLSLHEELSRSTDPAAPKLLEQTDKLLTQIDYHQMLSHLSSSTSIYFPFAWDQLEGGSLVFKKSNEKKFYCEINLKLKEYGELDLMMGLYDETQLEIQAHTEKSSLKSLIQENMAELRSLLIKAGLTPRAIRVIDKRETQTPLTENYISTEGSDMGFEVKV